MEEIKFRAWNYEKKIMLEWNELLGNPELLRPFFGNEQFMCNPPRPVWARMQYTGLKDKTGKEIYDGDIVKAQEESSCEITGEIKFVGGMFDLVVDDCGYGLGFCLSYDSLEIIGNIYEGNRA